MWIFFEPSCHVPSHNWAPFTHHISCHVPSHNWAPFTHHNPSSIVSIVSFFVTWKKLWSQQVCVYLIISFEFGLFLKNISVFFTEKPKKKMFDFRVFHLRYSNRKCQKSLKVIAVHLISKSHPNWSFDGKLKCGNNQSKWIITIVVVLCPLFWRAKKNISIIRA